MTPVLAGDLARFRRRIKTCWCAVMSTVSTESTKHVQDLINQANRLSQVNTNPVPIRSRATTDARKNRILCKARFSYSAEQRDELTFNVDDEIEALETIEDGWMRGKHLATDKVGLFPTNYCAFSVDNPEKLLDDRKAVVAALTAARESAPLLAHKPSQSTERAKVLYPYDPCEVDELSLREGDIVTIISTRSNDEGWYEGEIHGKRGVFPSNFVELLPPEKPAAVSPSLSTISTKLSKPRGSSPPASTTTTTTPASAPVLPAAATAAVVPPPTPPTKPKASLPFLRATKEATSLDHNEPTSAASTTAPAPAPVTTAPGSRIKEMQKKIFADRNPPKPGDKIGLGLNRPKTTILDNVTIDDGESKPASDTSERLVHLNRDRPRQNKRPPSMFPPTTTSSSTELPSEPSTTPAAVLTTGSTRFPVKDSPPVGVQKPALIPPVASKIASNAAEGVKEHSRTTFKASSHEATIVPNKTTTAFTPQPATTPAVASSASTSKPPLGEWVSRTEFLAVTKQLGDLESRYDELKGKYDAVVAQVGTLSDQVSSLQASIPPSTSKF